MNRLVRFFATAIFAYGFSAWCFVPGSVAAEKVFQKRTVDGTVVFSDTPLNDQGQRVSYTAYYGRKTATASCKGQTESSLQSRRNALKPEFTEAAKTTGVDRELLHAVAQIESCFDSNAVSVAGAQGVMQLMPRTADELGVRNSFDARANILGGATYLKRMMARHDGDISLALASYNAGPGSVEKHGGIPPYPETIRYVELVTKQLSENRRNTATN